MRELSQLCLGVGLMGGLMAFIFLLVTFVLAQARHQRERLASLAERWRGRIESDGFGARLLFEVDGRPARVTYHSGSKNNPAWTRLEVERERPGPRLHLAPEGFWATMKKLFGAEDISLGEGAFDGAFLVQSSFPEWARAVLGPVEREHLLALRRFGDVRLDVTAAGLIRLSVGRNLTAASPESLDEFMERGTAVARSLVTSRAASNEPAREPPQVSVRPRERARCPVCADDIATAAARRCGRCETAHHAECWEFIGGCAVFGCERSKPRDRTRAAPEAW